MITIGVDAHKGVHVALAVDEAGQELGQWQGVNSAAGLSPPIPWPRRRARARVRNTRTLSAVLSRTQGEGCRQFAPSP